MFKYGKNSTKQLMTCHKDIQLIFLEAISRSKIDFGISEGHRSIPRQYQLYIEGKSKIDGINKIGKHNTKPSEALDIYIYHPNLETRRKLAYDKSHLSYIAGLVDSISIELYEKGITKHLIRWGGNWDNDDIIDYDQPFDDFPHFEIIKP